MSFDSEHEPLKIQVFSDWHFEKITQTLNESNYPPATADYLFLAGDISNLVKGEGKINLVKFLTYASKQWKKVFYVLGNHEFWHPKKSIELLTSEYKILMAQFPNIHLLDNCAVSLNDTVEVYGCTFWTPYNWATYSDHFVYKLNDCLHLRMNYGTNYMTSQPISQAYMNELSAYQYGQLANHLQNTRKKTIILTHFPPLQKGTMENTHSPLKDYFAWNGQILNKLCLDYVCAWISGHTHYSYDFMIIPTVNKDGLTRGFRCRFISNQIGYVNELASGITRVSQYGSYELTVN